MAHMENQMQKTFWLDYLKSKKWVQNTSCLWMALTQKLSIESFKPSVILGSI